MSVAAGSAAAPTSAPVLFEDLFDVVKVNPEEKKFERVDRLVCKAETYETEMVIDIASEIFPMKAGDKFTFALAWTLDKSGKPDSDYYEPDSKVGAAAVLPPRGAWLDRGGDTGCRAAAILRRQFACACRRASWTSTTTACVARSSSMTT